MTAILGGLIDRWLLYPGHFTHRITMVTEGLQSVVQPRHKLWS